MTAIENEYNYLYTVFINNLNPFLFILSTMSDFQIIHKHFLTPLPPLVYNFDPNLCICKTVNKFILLSVYSLSPNLFYLEFLLPPFIPLPYLHLHQVLLLECCTED